MAEHADAVKLMVERGQRKECLGNLRQIDAAKMQWALEQGKSEVAIPTAKDLWGLSGLLREEPKCPAGGTYIAGSVKKSPTCSIHGALPGVTP